jgi:hypothetical protein
MQTRAGRWMLVAVLLLAGAGAAAMTWTLGRRVTELDAAEREATGSIDRVVAAVHDVGLVQAAYVAPLQDTERLRTRVTSDLQQITATIATLRLHTRSVDAAPRLQTVTAAAGRLEEIDATIRQLLDDFDVLMASGLIFGEAQQHGAALIGSLQQLRDAEASTAVTERDVLMQQAWGTIGLAALIWLLGVVLLARMPARPLAAPSLPSSPGLPSADSSDAGASAPAVDLNAAADLCTALSRVTSTAALPDLLARAAAILDASGVILWVGTAEELFPAASHGYDPRVISRLGPIGRHAENATAAAWRTGELRTVAGDMVTNGAIVAPLFGPEECVGVLAAEVRHGREGDPATRAVTEMIAAQLATAVSAWPQPQARAI